MTDMYRYDIAIYVPGMPFHGDTIRTESLGGSETAGYYMARELAGLGHDVTVFSNGDRRGKYDGVMYAPAGEFRQYVSAVPSDVVVAQRVPDVFATRTAAKLNVLWQHDLALKRAESSFKGALWNVDKVFVVSEYMRSQYKKTYSLPDDEDLIYVTRNGIDLSLFDLDHGDVGPRDMKTIVYAARPERGLNVLLRGVMPKLLERDDEYRLVIVGYDNSPAHMREFYAEMTRLGSSFGDRVSFGGNLDKKSLYRLYGTAGAYVYPTPSSVMPNFREVSCITMMECMAAGLPVISSDAGALPETLAAGAGTLIPIEEYGDPWDDAFTSRMVDEIIRVTTDRDVWKDMSDTGKSHARGLDWKAVAEDWSRRFGEFITERNDDPIRLALDRIRHSDIFTAKKAIEGIDSPEAEKINRRLREEWGFSDPDAGLQAHYKAMGEVTDARISRDFAEGKITEEHFDRTFEKRFRLIEEILRDDPDSERILDYGCGHGWFDIYMERRLGRKWVGVDIDPGAVKWSEIFRDKFSKHPENLEFITGDHNVDLSGHAPFDALVMGEVLEHCVDPVTTAEKMERWVKPGGMVIITVPYGPWEYSSFESLKHRNHLHEFDSQCLKGIFRGKPGVEILCVHSGYSRELGEPLGFYLVRYRADHEPLGDIDWDRKIEIQRPRQTVTLSMIAGAGAYETAHWALAPLKHVVDDIVVGDCRMDDRTRKVFEDYGARIVTAPDPAVNGFDAARNATLDHITSDWILWIDTDERVTDPVAIHKYLRDNIYTGYSIRQHHFTVDADFKPDLPVRLFRNHRGLRWFGHVHEHPEKTINNGPGESIILNDVNIAHVGYLAESGRRTKFFRNRPLLEKSLRRYPDRKLNQHFAMRDNMLLARYHMESNGGVVDDRVRALCEDTIARYRKHFLGVGGYIARDAIENYSQACRMLGLGAEVAWNVSADKDGPPDDASLKLHRFATIADLKAELSKAADEAMSVYESEWY